MSQKGRSFFGFLVYESYPSGAQSPQCIKALEKQGLVPSYRKAKQYILDGHLESVDFRKRRPYKSEKYYFRINQQYHAFCYFETADTIHIFEIDDHQDY